MTNPLRAFLLRPRLLIVIGVAVVAAVILPASLPTRLLVAWCVGTLLYIALALHMMLVLDQKALRAQSSELDDSAPVITLFAVLATLASIGGVAIMIFGGDQDEAQKVLHVGLAALTMISSWMFVQTSFAIHYAHVFYGDTDAGERRGGLQFSGDDDPDFWDFVYFAITIGAAAQTSDTQVCSKRMRHIVSAHSIYSYFFNTTVLAFAVNIATELAPG